MVHDGAAVVEDGGVRCGGTGRRRVGQGMAQCARRDPQYKDNRENGMRGRAVGKEQFIGGGRCVACRRACRVQLGRGHKSTGDAQAAAVVVVVVQ